MGITSEFQGPQETHGDFSFSVARDSCGNVWGLRRLLSGDRLDVSQPPEIVKRDNLPSESLQRQYDILVAGSMPAVGVVLQSGKTVPVDEITNYGLRA